MSRLTDFLAVCLQRRSDRLGPTTGVSKRRLWKASLLRPLIILVVALVVTLQGATVEAVPLNQPPVANAGPDQEVVLGSPVTLNGSASTDDMDNITSYDWDFDDGNTGSGIEVMHTYSTSGIFTVTLEVLDADGASDVDHAVVTVQTAAEATQDLIDDVDGLVPGTLNSGQGNSLTTKLANAIAKLNGGMTTAGCNQLQAFINQVNSFIRNGILTVAQGQPLIDAATAIRNAAGC